MAKLTKPVLLAVFGAAHGIKGEVRIKSYTADPESLADYGVLQARDGRTFELLSVRPQGDMIVARIKGVNDRNQAEALTGIELFVDRSKLPAEEEGEFFHEDLVGLSVRDENGATIGKVTSVQNFGGGDILELDVEGRRGVLIPFTHAAAPEVDVVAGFIRIDTIAAGLVDDEDEMPDRPVRPMRPDDDQPKGGRRDVRGQTKRAKGAKEVTSEGDKRPKPAGAGRLSASLRPRGPKDSGGNR